MSAHVTRTTPCAFIRLAPAPHHELGKRKPCSHTGVADLERRHRGQAAVIDSSWQSTGARGSNAPETDDSKLGLKNRLSNFRSRA